MRIVLAVIATVAAAPASAAVPLRQEFPFPKAMVFEALVAELPAAGFKVREQDALLARVTASSGMSLTSYGETMSMVVVDVEPGKSSAIEFAGNLKMATNIFATGKPRKDFDKVVFGVSRRLQALPRPN